MPVIIGTEGADTLNGAADADEISGLGGSDTIFGGEGDDVIDGGDDADTVVAGEGADLIDGGAGNDRLSGNEGDDVIYGGPGGATILGGDGRDELHAGDDGSWIEGGAGADAIYGGAGTDWIFSDGPDPDPTLVSLAYGGGGVDFIFGSEGPDHIFGGDGNDEIEGGFGDDLLYGGEGNDRIDTLDTSIFPEDDFIDFVHGGAGDDYFIVGWGDSVDGGEGYDAAEIYLPSIGGADLTLDFRNYDASTIYNMPGGATLTGVERVWFIELGFGNDTFYDSDEGTVIAPSSGNDLVFAGGGQDVVLGSFGDDIVHAGAGDDYMEVLWDGQDLLTGDDGDDWFIMYHAEGVDRLYGGSETADSGYDGLDFSWPGGFAEVIVHLSGYATTRQGALIATFSGMEAVIGAPFNDVLIGDGANNLISGYRGDDWLVGGGGDDTFVTDDTFGFDQMFGGEGFDTLDYSALLSGVVVQLSGWASAGGSQIAAFSGMESVVGSQLDDSLIGTVASERIVGGDGADWIVSRGGADMLIGGAGDDRFVMGVDAIFGDAGFDSLDYSGAAGPVVVQLSGYSTHAGATLASFSGIEGAVGSAFDDALIGTAVDNRFVGGSGSDWIVGGAGDDWFAQGTEFGVDRLFGDAGVDTIDYSGAGSGVTVQLNGWSNSSAGVLFATFTGVENAIGGTFDDALIGSDSNNRLTGGAGADWIVGGGGDDVFMQGVEAGIDTLFGGTPGADAGFDTIDYSAAAAGVVVDLSGYAATNAGPASVTLAIFSGVEGAIGGAFNDALIGTGADNELSGGAGSDWIVGGLGADRLDGGSGDDRFVQILDTSVDQIAGGAGFDILDYGGATGGVAVHLSGYATTNANAALALLSGLEGAAGSNFDDALIGDNANNWFAGGAGSDWIVGGSGDDRFVQGLESGVDTMFGDDGFDTIDYSSATDAVSVNLSGRVANAADMTIALLSGVEAAIGGAAGDTLIGDASNNELTGGRGDDRLTGGAGADRFIYHSIGDGSDTITDFSRSDGDRIDLSAIDNVGGFPLNFGNARFPGAFGQVVAVSTSSTSTSVSLYLDGDEVADFVIHVIHTPGLVMSAQDFML